MQQIALRLGRSISIYVVPAILFLLVIGAVCAAIWAIVFSIMNYSRGDYAGQHFVNARSSALDALAVKYGLDFVSNMRFADPPVVNTHSNSALVGGRQVRIFHLVGPRGVKWCVWTWNGGSSNWSGPGEHGVDVGASYKIVKGCKF